MFFCLPHLLHVWCNEETFALLQWPPHDISFLCLAACCSTIILSDFVMILLDAIWEISGFLSSQWHITGRPGIHSYWSFNKREWVSQRRRNNSGASDDVRGAWFSGIHPKFGSVNHRSNRSWNDVWSPAFSYFLHRSVDCRGKSTVCLKIKITFSSCKSCALKARLANPMPTLVCERVANWARPHTLKLCAAFSTCCVFIQHPCDETCMLKTLIFGRARL